MLCQHRLGWWLVAGGWWLVAGGWWLVAGGWCQGTGTDPESVLSRTGCIIPLYSCPILWCSKLQTELIALSTTEAEYIALSQSMQEVNPLMDIYNSILAIMQCDKMQPNAPFLKTTMVG
jgi:hypothetical protein